MPIPTPKPNETQDDFISRCMGDAVMNKEYPDQKQRSGVCYTKWREKKEMKLETVNIGEVEIFSTGSWKGKDYTEKDIDDMVENFNNRITEPYITIDHSSEATAQFKDALRALALGFVDKLQRKGNKLVAWFKQVPKTIADLIQAGALKKKSIEFYSQFIANGKLYKNVLQGITFHGANGLPEVNTLSDFINLYKSNLQVMSTENKDIVSISNTDKEVNIPMDKDKIELKHDEHQELLKKVSRLNVTLEENQSLKDSLETLKVDSDKIEKEYKELKLKVEKIEKEKKKSLNDEAEKYVSKKINDGIILAKFKDRYVAEYISYKDDEDKFKDFMADIESRGKVVDLSPTKSKSTTMENFKYNPEEMDFKAGSTIDYDELEDNIQAVMKAKNCSWEDAAKECGVLNPEELGREEVAK